MIPNFVSISSTPTSSISNCTKKLKKIKKNVLIVFCGHEIKGWKDILILTMTGYDIKQQANYYDNLYQTTYHDAILRLKVYVPKKIQITHVKSHADSRKKLKDLTLSDRLNIRPDKILFTSPSVQLVTNIKDIPFGIYI